MLEKCDKQSVFAAFDDILVNWRSWNAHAEVMFDAAAQRLLRAITTWELKNVRRLPDGAVSLVCEATRAQTPVVLKVNPVAPNWPATSEAAALRVWEQTKAAVAVIEERDDGQTLLLMRVTPGTALTAQGWEVEAQLQVLGRLALELHTVEANLGIFPSLAESEYARSWRRGLAAHPQALARLEQLLHTTKPTLLHNDLHTGNVLWDGERWLAIDPKAVVGDAHADSWALLEFASRLSANRERACSQARSWARVYAQAAALDEQRLRAWASTRALAEAHGGWNSPRMIANLKRAWRAFADD